MIYITAAAGITILLHLMDLELRLMIARRRKTTVKVMYII